MNWGMKGIGNTRWGDIEVYDEEEIQDILRHGVKKEKPTLVELNFTVRTKCKGCCFKKHSNPPSDVSEEEKAYCCVWCSKSGGKRHGGRCEQLR